MKLKLFFAFFYCFIANVSYAQLPVDKKFTRQLWEAKWITYPTAGLKNYEVFHFRKRFQLETVPKSFVVHISADSRYKFFINGKMIGLGPARSDLAHWYFDTYDLAPYLNKGENILAALIWNQGEYNALSQHSYRTGLIMQGNSAQEAIINTDERWKVFKDTAYTPIVFKPSDPRLFWQYYVAGALDSVRAAVYPWNWEKAGFNDSDWRSAKNSGNGTPDGIENHNWWNLTPRPVAFLQSTAERFAALRKSSGVIVPLTFPASPSPISIPANSKALLLLDTKYEATGYPHLIVSKGNNSIVKISYAETLLDIEKNNPYKWHKTNRNEIEGKKFVGVYDVFVPDGGNGRLFTPLWMRVFRYVQVEIETKDEPLVIDDLSYDLTRYPFRNEANFSTSDPLHQKIAEACLRTVQLASQETYIDPYYEQMQYIGDTRIEALYAYYHFKDDRLTRNAINQFNWSRSPEGITMSRYPSELPQYTPLFSLCWMLMINDYWMLRNDEKFSKSFIPGMLNVLAWYESKINDEGMIGDLPYLDFLDSQYDRDKILNSSKSKSLTPYSLFFVYTVQQLKPFFKHFGKTAEIAHFEKIAEAVRQNVIRKCYDPAKHLFAENPEKKFFSQHSNIMAVLTGCGSPLQQKQLMQKVLSDTSLIQVSLYFKFYEFAALKQIGMGSEILNQMGDWKAMLNNGMNTFSEWLIDPRSDCHSWSAYPAYYFLNTIAGIQPRSPGFKTVSVQPNLGTLTIADATMPHRLGNINAHYQKQNNGLWEIKIELPKHLTGTLQWKGKNYPLKEGHSNTFLLKN